MSVAGLSDSQACLRDTELMGLRLTNQEMDMCRRLVGAHPRPLTS